MHKNNCKKLLYIALGIVVLLFMSSISSFASGMADSPWPCLGQNSRHTGRSLYAGPQKAAYRWKFQTGSSIGMPSPIGMTSPAIGEDGAIYIRSLDGYLYALDMYGNIKWDKVLINNTGPAKINAITSSPAIGSNGTIYIGSEDGVIYAVDSENGSIINTYPTDNTDKIIQSSPVIGPDGTIYIGSNDTTLYALKSDFTLKWKYKTDGAIISSPALSNDGETVYVGSLDGKLYALHYDSLTYDADDPNSLLQWAYSGKDNPLGEIWGSPAIGDNGTIYIGSDSNSIHAIDPNGRKKWKYTTNGAIKGSPALGPEGKIYIGSLDKSLYVLNPDGSLHCKYKTERGIRSTPAIDKDGTVYIGIGDYQEGYIYAFNPKKNKDESLWSYKTPYSIWSSGAISSYGTLYIGSFGGYLYAFGKVAPPANLAVDNADDLKLRPKFSWDEVPHATKYEIEIGFNENFTHKISDPNIRNFSGEYIPKKDLEIGYEYYWRVRVVESDPDYVYPEDNQGIWAQGDSFIVEPITGNENIDIDITEDAYSAGEQIAVTITVRDNGGNTIADYNGTIEITSNDPDATIKINPDDAIAEKMSPSFKYKFVPQTDNGIKTFYITSKLAGSFKLSVSFLHKPESPQSEDIVITPGELHHFDVIQTIDDTVPGGKSAKVTVTAKNEFGVTKTNYSGTISISSSDSFASISSDEQNAPITSYQFKPDQDHGSHTFYVMYSTIGAQTITVTANGIAYTSNPSTVTIDDIVTVAITISDPGQVSAGAFFPLTIAVKDLSGNTVIDYDGTIDVLLTDQNAKYKMKSTDATSVKMPIHYTFTPSDKGTKTFYILSTQAGSQTITVSSDKKAETKTLDLLFEAGALDHFAIEHSNSNVPESVSRKIIVTAKDLNENTITDYEGTIKFYCSDLTTIIYDTHGNVVNSGYTFTPEDEGSHTFYIIYQRVGDQTIKISVPASTITIPPIEYKVMAEDIRDIPLRRISIVSGDKQSARTLSMLEEPLTVRVTDASGDPLENIEVRFLINPDMPKIEDPTCQPYLSDIIVKTNADGLASTYLRLGCAVGTYLIEANFPDDGMAYGTYVTFSVKATALTIIKDEQSDNTFKLTASDDKGNYYWYIKNQKTGQWEYQKTGQSFTLDPKSYGSSDLDFARIYTISLIDTLNKAEDTIVITVPVKMEPKSKIFLSGGDAQILTLKGSVGENITYTWAVLASVNDTVAVSNITMYGKFLSGTTTSVPSNSFKPAIINPDIEDLAFYIRVTINNDADLSGNLSTPVFGPFRIINGRIISGTVTGKGVANALGIEDVAVRLGKYTENSEQILAEDSDPVLTDKQGYFELSISSNLLNNSDISEFYFTAYKEGYVTTSTPRLDASVFESDEAVTIDFSLSKKTIIYTLTEILTDWALITISAEPNFTGNSDEIEVNLLKGDGDITDPEFDAANHSYIVKYLPNIDPAEYFILNINADTAADGNIGSPLAGFDDYVARSTFTSSQRAGIKVKKSVSDEITKSGGIVGLKYLGNHFSATFDERDMSAASTDKIALELKALEYQLVQPDDLFSTEVTVESTMVYEINALDPMTGDQIAGLNKATIKLPFVDPQNAFDITLESLKNGYYVVYYAKNIDSLAKGIGKVISQDKFLESAEGHISFISELGVFQVFYPVMDVEISSEKKIVSPGAIIQFNANVYYGKDDALFMQRYLTDMIQWNSSNTLVGTMKNGKFQAVKPGDVSITASKFNVVSDPIEITVTDYLRGRSTSGDLYGCFINSL
ncbi:MAG: PQQ-binding-like beta-propeller repeat protein [bacterium]